MAKIAVGTRFWGVNTEKDFPRINNFVEVGRQAGQVFVAVNTDEDKIGTINLFPEEAFPVTPWGKFVQPLNALILRAALAGANHLLLASAEFAPTLEQLDALLQHMNENTLVVGATFAEHEFHPGETIEGTGTTVPWNTFALWNLSHLSCLGIPMIGDAPFNQKMAGVEEVATISVYQSIYQISAARAKLVHVPGIGLDWNTEGWSGERLAKHQAKIDSKKERPAAQLKKCGLQPPLIQHVE